MRDGNEYQGIRVKLTGVIGRPQNAIGLDVSFGDPVWPPPQLIASPCVLDKGQSAPIAILGYSIVMMVAEKVITMIQHGDANKRWRNFAEVVAIADRHPMNESELGRR